MVYAGRSEDGLESFVIEQALDGGAPRVLLEAPAAEAELWPTGYAPDGSGMILSRYAGDDSDLWWLAADGSEARPLHATKASEDLARFSHDGRFVAYESNESGWQEVWVAVYLKGEGKLGGKWQVSLEGGRDPLWSADGRELYFENLDDRLVAVAIQRGTDDADDVAFGAHTPLFDLRQLNAAADGDESYDVAPSGGHFVFIQEATSAATEVRIVLHWFDELRQLVPIAGAS